MLWKHPITPKMLNERCKGTLSDHLGIVFVEVRPDGLLAKMPITPSLMQPMGSMHGGASCVLAETIGSVAANCCVDLSTHFCVGSHIHVSHLRSAISGTLSAWATPLHIGKTTHVWNIEILNESGKRVAVSQLTIAVVGKDRLRDAKSAAQI